MARKLDLNTIAKEYAEGRISKEDFLYLHKMISGNAGATSDEQAQPPVLTTPAQQQVPRRTIRPGMQGERVQQAHSQRTARPAVAMPAQQPHLAAKPPRGGILRYFRNHHKEAVALLGTLGIFISMFYNKINTVPPDDSKSRVVMVTQSDEKHSPRIRTQDVKLIAQLMMEDNSWNGELIDDFKAQWNKLTDSDKAHIKKSDWYLDFSSMLSRQIKTASTKAKTGDVASIYNQQALLSLADTLIFGNSERAEKMIAEVTQSNKPVRQKQEQNRPVEKSSKPSSTSTRKSSPEPRNVTSLEKPKTSGKNTQSLKRHRISRHEIEDVINRFTVAFEAGHSRELTDLFASEKFSSSFSSLNGIKSEYRELFRNSRDRQLELNSFFWEHDFDEARGTAKYNANVRLLDANISKTISADVDITLRRLKGKIYITQFKLKEKKVVASAPKFIKDMTKDIATKEKPRYPTPAELQDLVTQYVTAYETGDVDDLMKLFASATWTNSRSGLVEMKQNYSDLFDTTSDREVFIKNVKWEIKGDKAMGTGEMLLTIHTDDQVQTKKGKIRIVAQKSKDLVRFTQMFHILN